MKALLILMMSLLTTAAMAFEGTFTNESVAQGSIRSLEVKMFDLARTQWGCADSECYRLDVYINGEHYARWATSPGKPHWGTDFVGGYTPTYSGRPFHPSHINGYNYRSNARRDHMPYAMFVRLTSGGKSPIAIHGGVVTGRKESHGCIRLQTSNAKKLNELMKRAFAQGTTPRLWTKHVR